MSRPPIKKPAAAPVKTGQKRKPTTTPGSMRTQKPDERRDVDQNNTGTDLQTLKNIEKAFFRAHPTTIKRNTDKSLKWFSKYVPRAQNRIRNPVMFRDHNLWQEKVKIGTMVFFEYDPIHKKTLPVYDRYPLVFPFDVHRNEKNGKLYFTGLNLHYLPPPLRLRAMVALLELRNEKRYRRSTKLRMTWDLLKAMGQAKLFKRCVKQYCVNNVVTRFVNIPSQSWELAVFLPTHRFVYNKGGSNPWKQ